SCARRGVAASRRADTQTAFLIVLSSEIEPQTKFNLPCRARRTDGVSEKRRGHRADVVPILHIVQQILELSSKRHCRTSLPVGSAIGSAVPARTPALSAETTITTRTTLAARPARKTAAGQTTTLRLGKIIDAGGTVVTGSRTRRRLLASLQLHRPLHVHVDIDEAGADTAVAGNDRTAERIKRALVDDVVVV